MRRQNAVRGICAGLPSGADQDTVEDAEDASPEHRDAVVNPPPEGGRVANFPTKLGHVFILFYFSEKIRKVKVCVCCCVCVCGNGIEWDGFKYNK